MPEKRFLPQVPKILEPSLIMWIFRAIFFFDPKLVFRVDWVEYGDDLEIRVCVYNKFLQKIAFDLDGRVSAGSKGQIKSLYV